MAKKSSDEQLVTFNEAIISSYVNFCMEQGIRLSVAYKQLEQRLEALRELRIDLKS